MVSPILTFELLIAGGVPRATPTALSWHTNPLSTVDKMLSSSGKEIAMISADLGQQLENFVAQLVAAGRYNSKSEVLREGVRLVQDREARLAALDASIARGIADADAGRTTSAADVFDRLEGKYRALSQGAG
jgi:antitoxin ParD1/3/4